MFRGRLLAESLRPGADVAVPGLLLVRLGRHDVSNSVSASQPDVWTFIDFELPDEHVDVLTSVLVESLRPEDGWYADYQSTTDARAEAVEFGRAAGTPEHQLDWGA